MLRPVVEYFDRSYEPSADRGGRARPRFTNHAFGVGLRLGSPLRHFVTPPPKGGGLSSVAAFAFVDFSTALLFEAAEGSAFVRMWIGADSVDLDAFVIFGQVFGDGKTFLIAEEQSMAVFPALHFLAGTDPGRFFDLFRLVLVEVAGTERSAELVDVFGETDHEELGDVFLGMEVGTALLSEVAGELPHLVEILLGRLLTIVVADVFDICHDSSPI